MKIAKTDDTKKILEYLKRYIDDCVYLYIDILNYGIMSDNMTVWIQEGSLGIELVLMKYYDSFQIFTHKEEYDLHEAYDIIVKEKVTMVSGRRDIIEQLASIFENVELSSGVVFLMEKYRKFNEDKNILLATKDDTLEIAKLICSDIEIGGHYTVDGLKKQLDERISSKTGRSYIIRDQGRLVAHTATYAETVDIAVVGGTIIAPDYRNTDCYIKLSNYMLQKLSEEGKKVYTFSIAEKMIRFHSLYHTKCGEYGKLVLK